MAEETKDTAPQAEPQEREEAPAQEAEQTAPEKSEAELLREQVDSLNDKLLRTMAEYDNFRKRSVREKEAIYPQATAAAVAQFCRSWTRSSGRSRRPAPTPNSKRASR